MKFLEAARNLLPWLGTLTRLVQQVRKGVEIARKLLAIPQTSYENLLLHLTLDIKDSRGSRAILSRRQRVRFLVEESGVVRDLVWGEGNPMARYGVSGARRLDVVAEGSRRVVLLGLASRPRRGEVAEIEARRLIRGGFKGKTGYFEALVERPTRRLSLQVKFPATRAPRLAHLVVSPPGHRARAVAIGYDANGRAFLHWSKSKPLEHRVYSLRWTW